MKSVFKVLLIAIFAQFILYTQADARGEIPPPPPFQGGNAGDWLGSGPVFGFEEPSLGNPWKGGGYGSGGGGNADPIGGGSNGGWGGAWWEGRGPLGGGGWGGWGSGLGPGSGGLGVDTDTTKKGHLWPEEQESPFRSCFVETLQGGTYRCLCRLNVSRRVPPSGQEVTGHCVHGGWQGADPAGDCPYSGLPCTGIW